MKPSIMVSTPPARHAHSEMIGGSPSKNIGGKAKISVAATKYQTAVSGVFSVSELMAPLYDGRNTQRVRQQDEVQHLFLGSVRRGARLHILHCAMLRITQRALLLVSSGLVRGPWRGCAASLEPPDTTEA